MIEVSDNPVEQFKRCHDKRRHRHCRPLRARREVLRARRDFLKESEFFMRRARDAARADASHRTSTFLCFSSPVVGGVSCDCFALKSCPSIYH